MSANGVSEQFVEANEWFEGMMSKLAALLLANRWTMMAIDAAVEASQGSELHCVVPLAQLQSFYRSECPHYLRQYMPNYLDRFQDAPVEDVMKEIGDFLRRVSNMVF